MDNLTSRTTFVQTKSVSHWRNAQGLILSGPPRYSGHPQFVCTKLVSTSLNWPLGTSRVLFFKPLGSQSNHCWKSLLHVWMRANNNQQWLFASGYLAASLGEMITLLLAPYGGRRAFMLVYTQTMLWKHFFHVNFNLLVAFNKVTLMTIICIFGKLCIAYRSCNYISYGKRL